MTEKTPAHSQRAGSESFTADSDNALALSRLYEQFSRPIHSYIYHLLGNREDADDMTQEVFIRACLAWDHLHDRENLAAWLYRIATNLCVDLLRRRKRIAWWPLSLSSHQSNHDESSISEEFALLLADSGGIPEVIEREHIRAALAAMPFDYAVVLVLSAVQGLPYQEIAAIIGISPNAAATRISRAKKMFIERYIRIGREHLKGEERRR
ncbi:MAG: RNA polymerase sigma factor [Thermogemmatispora sp.]|uniref:RNA polymerase sigma factor n=2 Tax=Thermogemmatispora sp. TaxID=1968838 RepID=UPI001D327139|nr:RNA polymerase sigma factor [Thermogemmatispora sp.]MBX5451012.1 RNA polymerase sigma factor [Thermogemmatispora sp.]